MFQAFKEFKPAFLFLGKFLGLYLLGNLIYGLYIESFDNKRADPVTENVTHQVTVFLDWFGEDVSSNLNQDTPTVSLLRADKRILNVYEGCNGVNVMIVFIAFILAFGGPLTAMGWFSVAGLVILHLANIGRILLLYFTALQYKQYFYYVHKYFFTAILYLIVFSLWFLWIIKFNVRPIDKQPRIQDRVD